VPNHHTIRAGNGCVCDALRRLCGRAAATSPSNVGRCRHFFRTRRHGRAARTPCLHPATATSTGARWRQWRPAAVYHIQARGNLLSPGGATDCANRRASCYRRWTDTLNATTPPPPRCLTAVVSWCRGHSKPGKHLACRFRFTLLLTTIRHAALTPTPTTQAAKRKTWFHARAVRGARLSRPVLPRHAALSPGGLLLPLPPVYTYLAIASFSICVDSVLPDRDELVHGHGQQRRAVGRHSVPVDLYQ